MDTRYADLETELRRIPEVSAARVVFDDHGKPTEVHILASPERPAKQVARDIQSVAMASFGLDIDHRLISVVQLDGDVPAGGGPDADRPVSMYRGSAGAPAEPRATAAAGARTGRRSGAARPIDASAAPISSGRDEAERPSATAAEPAFFAAAAAPETDTDRILVDGIVAVRSSNGSLTEVSLTRAGEYAKGRAEGGITAAAGLRVVAQATLDALRHFEPAAGRADVESATLVHHGDRMVALVTVVVALPPYEEVMAGAAVVRPAGEHDAIVRATLDALNRRLGHLR